MRQVERRQRLAAAGAGAFLAAAGAEGFALVWLVGARLFALWPERLVAPGVAAATVGAVVLGAAIRAFCRRPAPLAPARLIDRRTDGHDLFLTAALLDRSPGEYRALVLDQAQSRAATVRAADVLPFHWRFAVGRVAALGMIFTLAALFLPTLDPFDLGRQRRQVAKQREHLEETRRETMARATVVQQRPPETQRIEQAVASLEQTFQKAEPTRQQENQQRLAEHQAELGALWRQASDAQVRNALDPSHVEQAFGQGEPQEAQRWKEALRRGDTTELQKELHDLQDQIKNLAARPDSADKRAAQAQLQQKLGALANAASKALQSPSLNAALARAADQLAQGHNNSSLSAEAMQAAADSLSLGAQELDALGQSMKNLASLDAALKADQMAKQLNAQGGLDGKATGQCKGMADYAAAYARQLGEHEGIGKGAGPRRGLAAGGHVPQNGAASTDFHPEKSPDQHDRRQVAGAVADQRGFRTGGGAPG